MFEQPKAVQTAEEIAKSIDKILADLNNWKATLTNY